MLGSYLTRLLHTARITNIDFVLCGGRKKEGKASDVHENSYPQPWYKGEGGGGGWIEPLPGVFDMLSISKRFYL